MNKLAFVLGVIALASIVYLLIDRQITLESRNALASPYPELEWLKREYSLSNEQFRKIEIFHRQHDEKCKEYCRELAKCQQQLFRIIGSEPGHSPAVKSAVEDWRTQREKSQDAVLEYMYRVSSEMEPGNAKRYREHVYRTLILPAQTPHIDWSGKYHPKYIEHSR